MSENQYFQYGQEEIIFLKAKDPILAIAIQAIGPIHRPIIPDVYMAILNAIIGQQISTKALATIWQRMQDKFAPLTPETIAKLSSEEIQTCGISMRKAIYIKEMSVALCNGTINFSQLIYLSDEDICKELTKIKGIGTWTAEMLMIFSMQRKNIISWDDIANHRGLRMLYHHHKITPQLFAKYKRRYAPYAPIASLYLWAIAGGACPELTDPMRKKKK